MSVSQLLPRGIVLAVVVLVLAALGVVQCASASFVAQPHTVSSLIPRSFGLTVYRALDRVTPAPYVEETLAEDALSRGDLDAAEHYAVRLPAGARRDDLLGRIADARGETVLAREYYFAAPDFDRMKTAIAQLAKTDPASAYDLEVRFGARLAALQTHPDALAESLFMAGQLADAMARRNESLQNYERALALAPLSMKYLLNAANEAVALGQYDEARRYFTLGLSVNPASGDCLGGLGVVALREGNRAQAQQYAARARAVDPNAAMLRALDRDLEKHCHPERRCEAPLRLRSGQAPSKDRLKSNARHDPSTALRSAQDDIGSR